MFLFTKQGCGKCDWVKTRVDMGRIPDLQVMELNEDNPDALAMLAYFQCVSISEKQLPILVSDDENVIVGALKIRDFLQKRLN